MLKNNFNKDFDMFSMKHYLILYYRLGYIIYKASSPKLNSHFSMNRHSYFTGF